MLLLKWPSSFTLADLLCRKHRIYLYVLPETPLSSIFSRRPSRQTLSKTFVRSKKQRQPYSFLERHSLSLGQWGPADLLCFCVSDIPSVLVTVFSILPGKTSIFCWLLTLEVFQGNLGGWWGGSCLGLSCLYLFMDWDVGDFFSIKQELCYSSMIRWRAQWVFSWQQVAAGPKCLITSFLTPSGPGPFLHFQLFYCCFNLFHGDGLAHAVVWHGLLL